MPRSDPHRLPCCQHSLCEYLWSLLSLFWEISYGVLPLTPTVLLLPRVLQDSPRSVYCLANGLCIFTLSHCYLKYVSVSSKMTESLKLECYFLPLHHLYVFPQIIITPWQPFPEFSESWRYSYPFKSLILKERVK